MKRLLALSALALGGCVGSADVIIYNPLTVGKVPQQTEIVKEQSGVESYNGLPPMSMVNRAKLAELDSQKACFDVSLHSLRPDMDLRRLTAVLKEPEHGKIEGAQVWARDPEVRSYQGLVDQTERTGMETVCAQYDSTGRVCVRWVTRPTYATYRVPGTVNVYESNGRLCFNHQGYVTQKTERIILDLFSVQMNGWMPVKHGVAFRWGFAAVTKGADK
jgi:hypothetical protein